MRKNLLPLLILLLIFSLFSSIFNKKNTQNADPTQPINIFTDKNSYSQGKTISLRIINNEKTPIAVDRHCDGPPLEIFKFEGGDWIRQIPKENGSSSDNADCAPITIQPGAESTISFIEWSNRLFAQTGQYKIDVPLSIGEEKTVISSNVFTITERSFLATIWNDAFYRPIYNALIFLIKITPGHSLGLAIILVTLLIRIILYFPSQKALRSQKNLQKLQPKLQEVQKKYKGNQEKIAMETMKIWKEHRINPLSSCLPLLIQMPILIALFYAIQGGLNPDNVNFLYPSLQDTDLSKINFNFLGLLNLKENNVILLPLIVGGLQFIQMKMTMAKNKKKASNEKTAEKAMEKSPSEKKSPTDEMQMVNNVMVYFMPVMIAVFTASLPAGVGLYWGVSTLFGIGQQILVNKEKDEHDPEVRVIEKPKSNP